MSRPGDRPDGEVRPPGVTYPMRRGPFQSNGASPWFTEQRLGTPGQPLRFAIDSGSNQVWTTSTLSAPGRCRHFSGGRFDYTRSQTFSFSDYIRLPYSFGPWGTMQVEQGRDLITVPDAAPLGIELNLAVDYSGPQFAQLNWDGGIGLPSASGYVNRGNSFVVQELMNRGLIDPTRAYVSFDWDHVAGKGSCLMGGYDTRRCIVTEGVFMPWTVCTAFEGVEYLWTTDLQSYRVGGHLVAQDVQFGLDSGSSQFQGDDTIMTKTLRLIASLDTPEVVLGINGGELTVTADLYDVTVEAGPDRGQTLPQFQPLGLTGLVQVGSVLMEWCYTILVYRTVACAPGVYSLAPIGMWLFNKPGGPKVVTKPTAEPLPSATPSTSRYGSRQAATRIFARGRQDSAASLQQGGRW